MGLVEEAGRETALAGGIRGRAGPAIGAQRAALRRRLLQSQPTLAELLVQVADLLRIVGAKLP
jgi:hypothetical protein